MPELMTKEALTKLLNRIVDDDLLAKWNTKPDDIPEAQWLRWKEILIHQGKPPRQGCCGRNNEKTLY